MNRQERRERQREHDGVVTGVRSTEFTPEEFRRGLFALARANPWMFGPGGPPEELDESEDARC